MSRSRYPLAAFSLLAVLHCTASTVSIIRGPLDTHVKVGTTTKLGCLVSSCDTEVLWYKEGRRNAIDSNDPGVVETNEQYSCDESQDGCCTNSTLEIIDSPKELNHTAFTCGIEVFEDAIGRVVAHNSYMAQLLTFCKSSYAEMQYRYDTLFVIHHVQRRTHTRKRLKPLPLPLRFPPQRLPAAHP